jgi:hypothetical protein
MVSVLLSAGRALPAVIHPQFVIDPIQGNLSEIPLHQQQQGPNYFGL